MITLKVYITSSFTEVASGSYLMSNIVFQSKINRKFPRKKKYIFILNIIMHFGFRQNK